MNPHFVIVTQDGKKIKKIENTQIEEINSVN